MIHRRTVFLAWPAFVLAVGLFAGGPVIADDVDALDRELLEALEGRPPADSPERIVPRLIESTKTTAERIEQGRLDEETAALQKQILADIDALLQQSTPPNQPPQNRQSPGSPSQQSQDSQSEQQQQNSQNQQDGESGSSAASKESQQRTTRGEGGAEEVERRLGLSTAAWGHLPPKVREQMRSAFSEEYLPEYDALVRRYYEALARRRDADGDRQER